MIPPSCRRHEYQYLWHASVSERSISRARAEHYGYRVSGCVSAAVPVSGIAAKRSAMTKSRNRPYLALRRPLLCRLQLSNINRVMHGL